MLTSERVSFVRATITKFGGPIAIFGGLVSISSSLIADLITRGGRTFSSAGRTG